MDWQGQKLSEQLMQYLLLTSGAVAFLTGYFMASYKMMLLVYGVGFFITFIVTVPDWFYFNSNSLEWAQPSHTDTPTSKVLRHRQQQQQQLQQLQQQAARKSTKGASKR